MNNYSNKETYIVFFAAITIIVLLIMSMIKTPVEVKDVDEEKENMMDLSLLDNLKLPEKQEITSFKKVKKEVFFKYGNNNNYIINDGRRVYQGCTRYLENIAIIDGYRFGLVRIEWHKSVLTWKGIKVGLELHIVHSDVESNQVITFVFPLSLVDLRKEFFTDLSYHNQPTDVATLNSLLTRIDQIPAYYCCTPNQGAMVNFNLCPIANLILIQKYFYEYKMSQNITWFIAQPQMFDRTIGLNIRSKLVG